MKKFTVLATFAKGYDSNGDENITHDWFSVLIPSRNNKMIRQVTDILEQFLEEQQIKRFPEYVNRAHNRLTRELGQLALSGQQFRPGKNPWILRKNETILDDDGGFIRTFVIGYEIEVTPNAQADFKSLYSQIDDGTGHRVDRASVPFLLDKLKSHGLEVVDTIGGLETFSRCTYDGEGSYDLCSVIEELSRSIIPLYNNLRHWLQACGERMIDYAYDGNGTIDECFYPCWPEPVFQSKDESCAENSSSYRYHHYDITENDDGLYGWVHLVKLPIIGKIRNPQS